MQLIYRGISYQPSTTPIQSNQTTTIAKFLSQSYQVSNLFICPLRRNIPLKYRGISYNSDNSNLNVGQLNNFDYSINQFLRTLKSGIYNVFF